MQRKIIFLFLITLLVISCEKDITIKLSGNENLLVVNSIISPDKPISFHLTRSVSILEKDTVIAVEKAKIEIFCDNILLETDSAGNNGTFTSAVYPQPGKLYSVKINSPNLPIVNASVKLPDMPQISYLSIDSISDYGYSFEMTTSVEDNLEQRFYYIIQLKAYVNKYNDPYLGWVDVPDYLDIRIFTNLTTVLNEVNTTSADETINLILGESNVYNAENDELLNWMAFSNEYFTSNFHEITIKSEYFIINTNKPIYIYLSKITEDYFKYLKTKELNKKVGSSPFSEPVQIFNNIDGGIGIFGGMTTVVDSIFINPQN